MNILWNLYGILSILLHIHEISGAKFQAIRNSSYGPLVLMLDQQLLKIAIPHKVGNRKDIADYFYNRDIEQGSVQEIMLACPAHNAQQKEVEEEWKNENQTPKETRLFFLQQYPTPDTKCLSNEQPAGPWIEKTETECGNSDGNIYEVGYPVNVLINTEGKKVLFMSIYEICYSKTEGGGIIHTIHRIVSPRLMLLNVHENYQPSMEMTFKSPLDAELKDVKKFYKNKNIYQFVPRHDMPTVLWGNTTFFPFNYLPIDSEIFSNLLKYDNYIRLYSKQTNTPLTIYSGTYQVTVAKVSTSFFGIKTRDVIVPIDFVWKAIVDPQNNGIILITQLTNSTPLEYLCSKDRMDLQYYKNGGCTYTCHFTPGMRTILKLPKLKIEGVLKIAYDKAVETESEITPVDAGDQTSSTQVSIADFANSASFVTALNSVDHATVVAMQAEGALGSHTDDGADDGGPGEGGE